MEAVFLYKAEDGQVFQNYQECLMHDFKEKFLKNKDINFGIYINDTLVENYFDDSLYLKVTHVVVSNEEGVKAMQYLAKYCHYYEYKDITSEGYWERDSKKQGFIKSR